MLSFEESFLPVNFIGCRPCSCSASDCVGCMFSSGVPMNCERCPSAVPQPFITYGKVPAHLRRLKKASLQLNTQQQQCDEAAEKLARSTAAAAAAAEAWQRHQTELEERVAAATAAVTASQQACSMYNTRESRSIFLFRLSPCTSTRPVSVI